MPTAYSYGVAGSPVVPMTRIGGAPFAPSTAGCLGPGLTGHSGQARSGPFSRPKIGARRDSSASSSPRRARYRPGCQGSELPERNELPVSAIAVPPIRGVGQLQQPSAIPVDDRCGERISQLRPATQPPYMAKDRLDALLLAEVRPPSTASGC